MKSIVDSAIEYLKQGFSIVPSSPQTKVPLVPWAEYQNRLPGENEICSWFKQHPKAMLSLVTGEFSGITVVDADSEEAISRIEEVLPESLEIPCTQTPRGGKHFYFSYDPSIPTRAGRLPNIDTRNNGGCIVCPPSKNTEGKFYTWLGLELSRKNLQPMPDSLHALLTETQSQPTATCATSREHTINNIHTIYNKKTNDREGDDNFDDTPPLFSEGRRDTDLFTLANSLVKSGMPERDIFKYLEFIIHSWGEHDETWINTKIQSALKRQEKRDGKFSDEVKEWILSSKGIFLSSDVVKSLQVSSRDEQKNLSKILSRLCDEGVIERHGNKNGCFRKIEKDYEIIDLSSVSVTPLPIVWPFNIHEKVYILPKSVGVIAGQTDAGKSAYCLNFAYMNRERMKVRYLTSEMGAQEIKSRISHLNVPDVEWEKIEFIERSGNFQDLVLSDGITVIDYMEKTENFYEIARDIKEIFDRLKTGFCLISIQKKEGQDFGRGGDFSAEKSRLYLSMSPGRLKIVKAKNWVKSDVNPNRLECEFKLVGGIKFIQTSGWKRPN